jgi:hypothetical protein
MDGHLRPCTASANAGLARSTGNAVRLEEHDDPARPVIALAKRRIVELIADRERSEQELAALESQPPADVHPEAVEAALASVPDLCDALYEYDPAELAQMLEDFDIDVEYEKQRTLRIAATLQLDPPPERLQPPCRRSQNSDIAGAGFEPATSGL